jgi:Fuc2NAc and GlcNAc transferase
LLVLLLPAAILALATLAAVLAGWTRRWLLARGMLDHPNARSMHEQPTPRGGGLAIAVVVVLVTLLVQPWLGQPAGAALLLLQAGAALLGWCDDRQGLSARFRLGIQLTLTLVASLLCWLPLVWHEALPVAGAAFALVLTIPALIWLINLYNFMDGADGLAGLQAVTAGLAGALLLGLAGASGLAWVSAALAAGSLGFLVLNWPPARLFMGDVGSYLLGAGFGGLALVARVGGHLPLAVWFILLAPFVVDATLTLVFRAARGERLTEAHRQHLYQRVLKSGVSSDRLLTGLLLLQLLLWPMSWWASVEPALGPWLVAVLYAGLTFVWWRGCQVHPAV